MDIYDQIVEEQVYISYMASGITYEVIDQLPPYERHLIHTIIDKFKQQEIEAFKNRQKQ